MDATFSIGRVTIGISICSLERSLLDNDGRVTAAESCNTRTMLRYYSITHIESLQAMERSLTKVCHDTSARLILRPRKRCEGDTNFLRTWDLGIDGLESRSG